MEEHELAAKLLDVSYNKEYVRVRNQWDQGWAVHVVHNVHGTQSPFPSPAESCCRVKQIFFSNTADA
jgi:hypothetical protein